MIRQEMDVQTLKDALAQKEAETAVLHAQMNELTDELDRFIRVTSHDMKNPAQGILQVASWIEEDFGDSLDEEIIEMLQMLMVRSQRLMTFADDLIEFSRAKRTFFDIVDVDVRASVLVVVERLAPPAGFVVNVPDAMPTVIVEREKLEQMFKHLIGNAIKFHKEPSNGVVNITWSEVDKDFYQFSVQDNGPGIPPQFHEKIFIPYEKLESRDEIEGTGLGLSFVQKVVTFMGGTVTLVSDVGEGTTVMFTWPKIQEGA